ncbi:uncharacterized protein [Palaemon carinicauda]|uniref:uncharacterized protein n=1 Tax=Palaemon carinicauda TaxID=392227 RepID=UPI0035B597CD
MHKQSHSAKLSFDKCKIIGGSKWLKTYKVMPTVGTLKASLQAQRKFSDQSTLLQGHSWQQTTPSSRKVLARILLNRLKKVTETILPESQCGFPSSKGTIDMMFCARQLQEKSKEQQKPIFLIYYDLEKAYDSIPKPAKWGEIKYRLDGGIFELARLKSQCNTNTINLMELQYADGNAAIAHTQAELEDSVDNFHAAYMCFGLTVNKVKTEILAQQIPGTSPPVTNITMDGTAIEFVEHFPYLESILSTQSTFSKDIENRLQSGHTAYGRLSTRVFMNRDLTTHTKAMVYNAII